MAFKDFFGNMFKKPVKTEGYFKMLDGYTPVYTSFNGGLYEMAQTKAIINTIATDCGKSIPQLKGHNKALEYMLQKRPNNFMSTSNFIERAVTCLLCDNNAFIIPMLDPFDRVVGLFPIKQSQTELVSVNGEAFLKFTFSTGESGAIEYSRVGHLKRMQYSSDVFGDSNRALIPTLSLMDQQRQSTMHALKESGAIRFQAQLTQQMFEDDLTKERDIFAKLNFSNENKQLMIFDSRYKDVKQVESKPIYLDEKQQALIDENIEKYFGVSPKVIKHEFTDDEWNAYYEGVIEPILIKLSEEITKMVYTESQIMSGNMVYFTANRLQYMSNSAKLQFSTSMFDRGLITGNDVADVWNLPHYEGGDKRFIRKEYVEYNKIDEVEETEGEEDAN